MSNILYTALMTAPAQPVTEFYGAVAAADNLITALRVEPWMDFMRRGLFYGAVQLDDSMRKRVLTTQLALALGWHSASTNPGSYLTDADQEILGTSRQRTALQEAYLRWKTGVWDVQARNVTSVTGMAGNLYAKYGRR